MTDPRLESLDPDQRRAAEALRDLRAGSADADFRARLRHQFAHGLLDAPERAGSAMRAPRDRGASFQPMAWLRWAAVPLAVSAVLVVVAMMDRPDPWRVTRVSGAADAVVDGRPVSLARPEELARAIRPGVRLRLPPSSELELESRGRIALHILPATDLTIPALPGRWFSRRVVGEVTSGEVRIVTGAAFRGATLAIDTPAAKVMVTGTTLAVICEPEGTCVCVLEGHVEVGPAIGPMAAIDRGRLRYTFVDGREPAVADMRPSERIMLARMREEKAEGLGLSR